jgi:hypothetical protein
VAENEKVVVWLLEKVFAELKIPFIVCGKNPSQYIARCISKYGNATLIANPTEAHLHDLIVKAQCHVLPSLNSTGVKLKVIHALFAGRHCVVNRAAVDGSRLHSLCALADSPEDFRTVIRKLHQVPFTITDIAIRKDTLQSIFDVDKQTQQLTQWLS